MTELFIDGSWSMSREQSTWTATSPVTGEPLAEVAEGGRADASRAAVAAADAFSDWSSRTPFERAELLARVADLIRARRDELAHILTMDQGKPLYSEAYAEVDEVESQLRMAGEDAVRLEGSIPPSREHRKRVLVFRRALGPVAVITPWNWPYTMPIEMIAPALAAGNTVIWTPAPSTSVCGAALATVFADADLPAGVFNFVTGSGSVVGAELTRHRDTVAVAFVGSVRTGGQVARDAAGKRQILELGNNGPMVIMESADIKRAVDAAIDACFLCAGQSCIAAGRLLVAEGIAAEFQDRLSKAMSAQIRLGDPRLAETTMGPLNNPDVADKMEAHVNDATSRGADLILGGKRDEDFPTELYWEPTLLSKVPRDSLAASEETFGPIAPIIEIKSLDEAVTLTNQSGYGLGAGIFTSCLSEGLLYADRVKSGLVNINETTNYLEWHLPFGGRAGTASGIGRTGGRHIIEQFTETQTVIVSA